MHNHLPHSVSTNNTDNFTRLNEAAVHAEAPDEHNTEQLLREGYNRTCMNELQPVTHLSSSCSKAETKKCTA